MWELLTALKPNRVGFFKFQAIKLKIGYEALINKMSVYELFMTRIFKTAV